MSKKLELAPNLSLPIEAVTKKFGFFGQNGSGKTYGAMKLAELMLDAGGQIVVIDPVGVWYGLRLAADGKTPSGIEIPVFGGLHGDIPLESTAGELIADIIVDRGISAVLDVSQFGYDAERARFVEHFARRIFNRKKSAPSALHVFFEEAQEFMPDRPNKGEEKLVHEVLRLGKIGRNYGFGWSLITPRPQEITTKARNLSEVVLAFQTNGTHERKAIAEWVKEKGEDLDVVDLLPKLKPGFAHAWSPSWLEFSDTIHINPKRTYDASATPKVGARAVEAKPLGSIDLEQLEKAMAATIEKRKAEDPTELKKQLGAANSRIRQLEKGALQSSHNVATPVVDQAAIRRAEARAIANAITRERKLLKPFLVQLQRLCVGVSSMPAIVGEIAKVVDRPFVPSTEDPAIPIDGEPLRRIVKPFAVPAARKPDIAPPSGDLSPGEQRILDAIAELNALGIDRTPRVMVGVVAGYNLSGGTPAAYVGSLVNRGLVAIPATGELALTDNGRGIARSDGMPGSLAELHNRVLIKLSDGERKIMEHLISSYPDKQSRADVGAAVGYNLSGGTPAAYVGKLVNLSFVQIPGKGELRAADVLFPQGLS